MTEKATNYRRLTLGETVDILMERKNTLILCHARPDCDTIGSGLALKKLLEAAGMKAHCLCMNEIPHRLEFLPSCQDSFLPENIPSDFGAERVISVDTASPAQLGDLREEYLGRVEMMIDHHGRGEQYADGFILPTASAAGELIFDISREMLRRGAVNEIPKDVDICLYAAISSDTGCFRFSSVTPRTHLIAAELLRSDIDAGELNHKLYDSKPFPQLKAEQLGFEAMKLYEDGGIAIIPFTYEMKTENGIEDQYTETLVDVARSIEGVEVAIAIRQPRDAGIFRCSMRSNSDFDVSKLCASFGGGGHVKAAGCTIEATSIEAAVELILAEIKRALAH